MPKQATIYVRVPAELYDRVEAVANQRGETMSVIVREACRQFFDRLEVAPQEKLYRLQEATSAPMPPAQPVSYTKPRKK